MLSIWRRISCPLHFCFFTLYTILSSITDLLKFPEFFRFLVAFLRTVLIVFTRNWTLPWQSGLDLPPCHLRSAFLVISPNFSFIFGQSLIVFYLCWNELGILWGRELLCNNSLEFRKGHYWSYNLKILDLIPKNRDQSCKAICLRSHSWLLAT